MALLEVNNVSVRYGRVVALRDVSLVVETGSVLAVLGRNGAGKSSLLSAIAGSVRPSSGRILWRGKDVTGQPAHRRARDGIALVPEGRRVFPGLTVGENMRLGGFQLGRAQFETALRRVFDSFPILAERRDSPAGSLSGGEQQMLAIGRALMSDAQLLLLDEPSLGLGPQVADEVYAQLQGLRDEGLTMILVEQQAHRALAFADDAIVLKLGRVALREAPSVLADDPRLVATYMGAVSEGAIMRE